MDYVGKSVGYVGKSVDYVGKSVGYVGKSVGYAAITHTFQPMKSIRSDVPWYKYIYYIPPPLTVHFSMTRSVRYQPTLHTLYYTLHTEHAYCLSYRFLNNVVTTTGIEMVEMVEILDGRLGRRSVERVRYVINNLLHLVIVKYGDISLVLCISTRLWLMTILSLLLKYLVIFHADRCNKSYICTSVSNTHVRVSVLRFKGAGS